MADLAVEDHLMVRRALTPSPSHLHPAAPSPEDHAPLASREVQLQEADLLVGDP